MKLTKNIIILIVLAVVVSVFASIWYWNKYMKKPKTNPLPDNNNNPTDDAPPTQLTAYSKIDGLEQLDMGVIPTGKVYAEGDKVGIVTGEKKVENIGDFYIIDGNYLIGKGSVTVS